MTTEEALQPDRFAAWLSGYPTLALGIPGQASVCPLAVYLRETLSLDGVQVGRRTINWHGGSVPLPAWAVQFVKAVDGQSAALTGEETTNILLLALDKARRSEQRLPQAKASLLRRVGLGTAPI